MSNTPYNPTWKKFEKDLHSNDPETSIKASDAFVEERESELKNSAKARAWEKSRKQTVAKEKKHFVKEMIAKEKAEDPIEQFKSQMKTAGVYEWGLTPTEGFVVVEVKQINSASRSGIYIPEDVQEGMENTGVVVGYGPGALHYSGLRVDCPAEVGRMILFKKGAGIEISLKGKKCRFMRFDDVLGVFDE